jgi:hypothetical protein
MPAIHERDEGFWPRLHERGHPVKLKDVSDNLKNYGISAGAYAIGVKLAVAAGLARQVSGYALLLIAVLFFVATLCQSWVLAAKQSQKTVPFTTSDRIRNGVKPALKVWFYLLVPLVLGFIAINIAFWFTQHAA